MVLLHQKRVTATARVTATETDRELAWIVHVVVVHNPLVHRRAPQHVLKGRVLLVHAHVRPHADACTTPAGADDAQDPATVGQFGQDYAAHSQHSQQGQGFVPLTGHVHQNSTSANKART